MTKRLTKFDIEKIANERNHTIASFGDSKNVHSTIQIQCNTCGADFSTTVHSYKNAKKTGCPECKKQGSSKTHKGKITSDETKRKIGEKASQREGSLKGRTGEQHPRYKGATGRDLKSPSTLDYEWKTAVRKKCNFTCVVTRESNRARKGGFVCHHLNSFDAFPEKRYLPENGVYLHRKIHKQFHDLYRYGNNTEALFAEFCEKYYDFDWFERKKELQL
jgi:hypothetical protein